MRKSYEEETGLLLKRFAKRLLRLRRERGALRSGLIEKSRDNEWTCQGKSRRVAEAPAIARIQKRDCIDAECERETNQREACLGTPGSDSSEVRRAVELGRDARLVDLDEEGNASLLKLRCNRASVWSSEKTKESGEGSVASSLGDSASETKEGGAYFRASTKEEGPERELNEQSSSLPKEGGRRKNGQDALLLGTLRHREALRGKRRKGWRKDTHVL